MLACLGSIGLACGHCPDLSSLICPATLCMVFFLCGRVAQQSCCDVWESLLAVLAACCFQLSTCAVLLTFARLHLPLLSCLISALFLAPHYMH